MIVELRCPSCVDEKAWFNTAQCTPKAVLSTFLGRLFTSPVCKFALFDYGLAGGSAADFVSPAIGSVDGKRHSLHDIPFIDQRSLADDFKDEHPHKET